MNKQLSYPCIAKFQQFVELKDFRPRTREAYLHYVVKLAQHFQRDPATLTEDELRQYFLFLRQRKRFGGSSMQLARTSLRSFFRDCLKREGWTVFEEVQVRRPEPLPFVLSREQVAAVLGAVREPRFRACLRLIYHCGLRVGEAVRIEVGHIDSDGGRIHIRLAKGGKDRYVPVATPMIEELRAWWKLHRNPRFLFPSPGRGWADRSESLSQCMQRAVEPMSTSSVQMAFRLAREASAIKAQATVHTLRHSYATHMLEEGASIRSLAAYLGHESIETTALYLHLTAVSEARTRQALATLHRAVTK